MELRLPKVGSNIRRDDEVRHDLSNGVAEATKLNEHFIRIDSALDFYRLMNTMTRDQSSWLRHKQSESM